MPTLLCLAAAAALLQLPGTARDTITLVVAATTDVHGRVLSWDYERDREAPLGLVRAATVTDSLRRVHPGRVILVDAGDLIQGNSFATYFARHPRADHPILATMNRMGYDAAAPGNHEFNFGLGVMQRALGSARFPYLAANIVDARTGLHPMAPYVLLDVAGVRVGLTGATTPGVLVWDGPAVRGVLDFRDIAEAVPPVVRRMRAAGADVTVLVVHAGLEGESSYPPGAAPPEDNVAAAIAAEPSLDLVVLGHTHREIADSVIARTLIVQPRNWAQSVAVAELTLAREGSRWRVVGRRGTVVPLAGVRPDSALVAALRPAHEEVLAWVRRPLGRSLAAMPARRARLEDTPVIDFINRVQQRRTGAQLSATAAFNPGGGIPAGDVTLADLTTLYPYENTLKAIRISGADLRAYLERTSRFYRGMGPEGPVVNDSIPGYNFDILSGVDYELDLTQPVGRRVARLAVGGRPVADTDSFTLALNSYRQQGGGGYAMLARAPVVYDRGETIRDLLAAEVERLGVLDPEAFFERNWRIRGLGPAPAAGDPRRTGAAPGRTDP
jgi:2',3'-cyclic-nucleotide 2'-phosphodiesterase/3'-nucleotidase